MTNDEIEWEAHTNKNNPHVYRTTSEKTARIWQERDGLDVRPPVEPYQEGTMGDIKYGPNLQGRRKDVDRLRGAHTKLLWYAPDESDPTYLHMVTEGYLD